MSVSPELLMRYYDGELSAEEASQVEAAIESDPNLVAQLEGMNQVGDFVRALSHERSALPAIDISAAVMQRIANEAKPSAPARNIVKFAPPSRMRYFAPAAFAALTLAASVVVWLRVGQGPEMRAVSSAMQQPALPPQPVIVEAPALEAEPEVPAATEVAIESVDFGAKTGTIFVVHGEQGADTPVVWLADDADAKKRRIESL